MTVEIVLDQMEAAHHTRYAQDSNQLAPFIMLFDEMGQLSAYTPVPMEDDREGTILTILTTVVTHESFGYVFSSEAWLSVVDKDEWEGGNHPMPRDDPKKQEVLIVEANSFAETAMRIYAIDRDAEGNFLKLRRTDMDKDGMRMHSRFDIFPRPKHTV